MAKTEGIAIWLPLYIGDFRRDTNGRGLVFKAMYLNLLMAMWENDGQLEDDEDYLAETAGATRAQWLQYRQNLSNLFFVQHGNWMHNGIREQLAKSRGISTERKKAGSRANDVRWAARRAEKQREQAAKDAEQQKIVDKIDADGTAVSSKSASEKRI